MEELISSIYTNPGDWEITKYTFNHKNGFKLWIANGFIFCNPDSSGMVISFRQKRKIWRAFKWWCANAHLESVR